MPRHDSIFKALLRSFFADLLRLAVPDLAGRLDLARPVFLDKEFFTAEGRRRELDLLARVSFVGAGGSSLLIHVEVEARARPGMGKRLWRYRNQIQAIGEPLEVTVRAAGNAGPFAVYEAGVELAGRLLVTGTVSTYSLSRLVVRNFGATDPVTRRPSDDVQLRQVQEVIVARAQSEIVLHHQRRDPQIVDGDRCPLLPQLAVQTRVLPSRRIGEIEDSYSRLGEEAKQRSLVLSALLAQRETGAELTEHDDGKMDALRFLQEALHLRIAIAEVAITVGIERDPQRHSSGSIRRWSASASSTSGSATQLPVISPRSRCWTGAPRRPVPVRSASIVTSLRLLPSLFARFRSVRSRADGTLRIVYCMQAV
jgi:hypothetical protein